MASGGGSKSVWRRLIGTPPRWQGIVWTAGGLCYVGLGFADTPHVWPWIIGGLWTILGVVTLTVSFGDYRHGRGRYAQRTTRLGSEPEASTPSTSRGGEKNHS